LGDTISINVTPTVDTATGSTANLDDEVGRLADNAAEAAENTKILGEKIDDTTNEAQEFGEVLRDLLNPELEL
jgi:methyl-accepting chemotaxis protein